MRERVLEPCRITWFSYAMSKSFSLPVFHSRVELPGSLTPPLGDFLCHKPRFRAAPDHLGRSARLLDFRAVPDHLVLLLWRRKKPVSFSFRAVPDHLVLLQGGPKLAREGRFRVVPSFEERGIRPFQGRAESPGSSTEHRCPRQNQPFQSRAKPPGSSTRRCACHCRHSFRAVSNHLALLLPALVNIGRAGFRAVPDHLVLLQSRVECFMVVRFRAVSDHLVLLPPCVRR